MKQLLLIVLLPIISWGQGPNTWVKKADFGGNKREQAVAFSINNKGYVATGVDTAENVLNDLWEYEPISDSWTQKANVPGSARRNAIAFATNTKGYVGLGIDADDAQIATKLSDFYEYDPTTNSWTPKANYPGGGGFGMYYGTAFSLDNKGYVVGGKIGQSQYINELWEYKPAIDQWALRAPFPGGIRYNLTSVATNGVAFVGLGTNQDTYTNDWWKYNPGTNSWNQETPFIGGDRGGANAFAINGNVYVTLGTNGGLKGDLFIYHPNTQQWHPRANYGGSERKQAVVFVIGTSAFVGTGSGVSGKKGSMYEYIPDVFLDLQEMETSFTLYPNPSNGEVQVHTQEKTDHYTLIDPTGNIVSEGNFTNDETIHFSNVSSGSYLFQLYNQSGQILGQQMLIIQE